MDLRSHWIVALKKKIPGSGLGKLQVCTLICELPISQWCWGIWMVWIIGSLIELTCTLTIPLGIIAPPLVLTAESRDISCCSRVLQPCFPPCRCWTCLRSCWIRLRPAPMRRVFSWSFFISHLWHSFAVRVAPCVNYTRLVHLHSDEAAVQKWQTPQASWRCDQHFISFFETIIC